MGSSSNTQPPVDEIQFDDTQVEFDEDLDDYDNEGVTPVAEDEWSFQSLGPDVLPKDILDVEEEDS